MHCTELFIYITQIYMHQNMNTSDVSKSPTSPWWWHLQHADTCRRFTDIWCVCVCVCIQGVPGGRDKTLTYVKIYWYNPKHLYPKLNSYGDNGQRKVWSSGGSTHCTCQLSSLIDVCPWVWCHMTVSPLTLAYSRLIPECAVSHVTSVLAFMCHV